MDHLLFLAQDKVEALQVSLRGSTSGVTNCLKHYSNGLRDFILQCVQQVQKNEVGARLISGGHGLIIALAQLNPKDVYQRITIILCSEENRNYIYIGGACFLLGGSIGFYVGGRLNNGIVAPHKMRAVVVNDYKGLEHVTVVEDMIAPQITNSHQVLVQVKAAGIDYLDIKVAEGYGRVLRNQLNKYNPNISGEFPVVLGRDCSGVVVSTGSKVTRVEPGDEVWLAVPMFHPGTLSEYIVVNESLLSIKPPHVTHEAVAALPYSIITAWDALVNQAGIGPDTSTNKRVLIHAGVSGVGVVALQMAKAWGASVTTTVSSRAAPLAQMLGANDIISYDSSNFNKELHIREKYDIILNTIGPLLIESCMKHCAPGGIVVTTSLPILASDSYGYFKGALYAIFIRIKYMFTKTPWLTGCSVNNLDINGSILDKVAPMITSGEIQPIVDKAYSAQDAEVAFAHVAKGDQIGKTVIRFRSRPISSHHERSC